MSRPKLRWRDYDNNGDVLPMGYKRLKDGTIIDTDCMDEEEEIYPCDYCIELECEHNGNVCPLWEKYNKEEDVREEKKNE